MDEEYRKMGFQGAQESFILRLFVQPEGWRLMLYNVGKLWVFETSPSLSNAARATRTTDFDSVYVNGFVMIVITSIPDFPQKRLTACLFSFPEGSWFYK